MKYRALGSTGIEASVLGFGCNRLGPTGDPRADRELEATLRAAVEHGVTLFDTANAYMDGHSEAMLGRVLKGDRDRLVLCSKIGQKHWASVAHERWTDPPRLRWSRPSRTGGPAAQEGYRPRPRPRRNYAPRMLELAVAGSLRRLRTDRLDVLHLHSPPPEVLADPEVLAKLDDLVERGWIRCHGVSFPRTASTSQIVGALSRWPSLRVVQVLINTQSSIDLARIAALTRERPIAVVTQQALEKGKLVTRTPLRTLLRFPLQSEGVSAVLVGMRTRAHLEDNLRAIEGPPLTDEEMARIRETAAIR